MLAQDERYQEERIAKHYVAFAHLAMQLSKLIEARDQNQSEGLDKTIKYLTSKIREGHLMEFGIELEWPINPTSETTLHPSDSSPSRP